MRTVWIRIVICCAVFCAGLGAASGQSASFESLLASAQQAQARSDFQSAAEYYRQAASLHPEIAEIRANLGLMYYQTGKDDLASESFGQALRLQPNLFVPNLFLGLEYVKLKRFSEAIPYFKRAALAKPSDIQVQIGLGQAYAGSGKPRLAVASYLRAAQIAPGNADAWYHLGLGYLEQVEADARILLTRHKDSTYSQALMAETFAEQSAFIEAEDAYQKVLASRNFPPDLHAMYGFVLLSQHDLAGAERELSAELASNPGSLMAKLGMAGLHVRQGTTEQAAKEIEEVWKADHGFLRANASLFNAGLRGEERSALQKTLHEGRSRDTSAEVASLVSGGARAEKLVEFSGGVASPAESAVRPHDASTGAAAELYAKGRYGECSEMLAARLAWIQPKGLRLLASCAYSTGDYLSTFNAAAKLVENAATEAEGLYWEIRSAEKLATQSLARASEIDSSSPKLHVLLGDVYRQRSNLPDAEKEYGKALAIQPGDAGATFGLCLALLADGKADDAYPLAQAELQKNPDDPELNAVMGEILCARRDFYGAEPYLKRSLDTKPELLSHVHALLGKVYAHTDRRQRAIAELKLALPNDKDGSLHYQIGRLYLKIGDREAAQRAFAVSRQMEQQGLTRATVTLKRDIADSEP